jgi:membrane protein YqaA with SNARE-associated domain
LSLMEEAKISARTKYILFTVIIVITTVLSVWLMIRYWREIAVLSEYGYLGIFIIAFIAGSSIPTPISYLLVTFTMGGILSWWLVGLCGGVGAGIGGTLVFLLGRGGRRIFPGFKDLSAEDRARDRFSNKFGDRFIGWAQKRGSIVVFVMSAMLNPVFAPMAIAMGAMRFRAPKFLIMCVLGNTLKALLIAYLGHLGVGSILRWLGGGT